MPPSVRVVIAAISSALAIPIATAQAGSPALSTISAIASERSCRLNSEAGKLSATESCDSSGVNPVPAYRDDTSKNDDASANSPDATSDKTGEGDPVVHLQKIRPPEPPDFNRSIYYRNRLEFSEDMGVFPINIPFPFDFMTGDSYGTYPLKYVLVPAISSLRWQICNLQGPSFLRGNWEVDISGAFVWIPSGPETRYIAYIMGMRRNFVPRNWRNTPYFDWRIGLGDINAKGPLGVPYAQGQDFTFTLNMGAGVRHNFSPRSGMTFGLNWMHISNANLSQGTPPNWGVRNYGINVLGPIFGVDFQLSRRQF
jgi:hypothetical protein